MVEVPHRLEVADTRSTEADAASVTASVRVTSPGSATGGSVVGSYGRLGSSSVASSARASSMRAPAGPAITRSRSGNEREARTSSAAEPCGRVAVTLSNSQALSRKATELTTMPEARSISRIGRKSTASLTTRPAAPRIACPISPSSSIPPRVAAASTSDGRSLPARARGTSHAPSSAPPRKPANAAAVRITPARQPAIPTSRVPTSTAMSTQFTAAPRPLARAATAAPTPTARADGRAASR